MDTLADLTVNELIEKARKYEAIKLKHNASCYKYYFSNHEEMKEKQRAYAKKYYQQKKAKMLPTT
jgi:hypothetical protein